MRYAAPSPRFNQWPPLTLRPRLIVSKTLFNGPCTQQKQTENEAKWKTIYYYHHYFPLLCACFPFLSGGNSFHVPRAVENDCHCRCHYLTTSTRLSTRDKRKTGHTSQMLGQKGDALNMSNISCQILWKNYSNFQSVSYSAWKLMSSDQLSSWWDNQWPLCVEFLQTFQRVTPSIGRLLCIERHLLAENSTIVNG